MKNGSEGRRHSHKSSGRVYVNFSNDAPVMEAYRMLKTNIEFSNSVSSIRKLLVTSSVLGEGKSTTVANLARMFALGGTKTVIVDLDLRRPVQHKILNVDCTDGITSCLIGKKSIEEVTYETSTENLFLIPCGEHPINPAELLATGALNENIDRLTEQFGIVILDSPPSAALADASIISHFSDATILVVSAGSTNYSDVESSLDNLKKAGANVLGIVMNNVTKKARGYKYYNYAYDY